jgi:hypothetical protein
MFLLQQIDKNVTPKNKRIPAHKVKELEFNSIRA